MNKELPQGAVQSICSSAATFSAIGMAFLGYWGYSSNEPWKPMDFLSVIPALLGIATLAYVPWVATQPSEDGGMSNLQKSRQAFAIGVASIIVAIVATLFT